MADESLSKNYEFRITTEWQGYVSSRDKTNIAENTLVRGSQNIYKKLSGTLSVRPGLKRRGVANTAVSPISSEFVWNTSWGATRPLIISENKLQVEYEGAFYDLLTGLTKTRYVFDKWWKASESKDRVLFVKGDADIQHWSGGIAEVSTTGTSTITKQDSTTSWFDVGFSTTSGEKKIMISGTEYTYTGGESTDTLTGVTPDASAIVAGTIAIQSVLTESNKPVANFKGDFIKVIGNRAYVGSYSSRLVYISSDTDFTNYTIPASIVPGSPNLVTLDSTGNGISVKAGNAWIAYGSGEWAEITFPTYTDSTGLLLEQLKVNPFPLTKQGSAYAHEFISNSGDNIVYLAKDKQVRVIGNFNNLFTEGYPSLSQDINTELSEETFTGGALKCIGDFTYLTAPTSGKVYLYQVRQTVNANGNVVAERLWHSPMTWSATRIDDINGTTYAFSNANPQIYQVWDTNQWHDDSPSDEDLSYSCILALAYRTGGRRQGLQSFDKVFTEGYITAGTPLTLTVNYEYQGSKIILTAPINSTTRPVYTLGGTTGGTLSPSSLGDESLGDTPLGDGIIPAVVDDLPKFKNINCFALENVFEYQTILSSDSADARWELLALGTNAKLEPDQFATFIINKA